MMIRRLVCLLVALLVIGAGVALADENLVLNGGFEDSSDGLNPDNWFRDMWYTSGGISDLGIEDSGVDGTKCVRVENLSENDARFAQVIEVEPNTCYRITGKIRAEDIDEGSAGASLSIKDTFVGTDYVYDTAGNWTEVSLVGMTAGDQASLTVLCRVGDYGSLTTGAAWFDDIRVEKVENAVLDATVESFQTQAPSSGEDAFPDEGGEADNSGLIMAALNLLVLIFVAACVLMTVFVERGRIELAREDSGKKTLGVILALALLLRLVISMAVRGYGVDITDFEAWSTRMWQLGPGAFYEADYFCDYPPGYLYVLWLLGGLRSLLHVPFDSNLDWLMVKLPPMLLDIGLACLLFHVARKHLGKTCALLIAGLCALNPAAILNSAAWGQIDVALAIMLVLSIHWAIEDKWLMALPLFALSILIKPQALMFAPLGLVAMVMRIVWEKQARIKWLLKMLGAVALSLLLMVLVCLPFAGTLDPELIARAGLTWLPARLQGFAWIVSLYGKTLGSYSYLTLNACNLYVLLDLNWKDLAQVPKLGYMAYGLMALGYAYASALYIKAKDAKKLPVLAALVLSVAFCFGPMMHERYLFPCIALLLLAYIMDRDVRLLAAFCMVTFSQFINAALVLRSEHLQAAEQLVNAGVSLVNLVACALLIWTAFDLCWRGRTVAITRVYHHMDAQAQAVRESRMEQFAETIFRPRDHKLNLKWRDWAIMLGLTLAYAAVAFTNLGSMTAPQSSWTSSAKGEQVVIDLGQTESFHLAYYGHSFNNVNFQVEFSDNGESWTTPYYAEFREGLIFRWLWYEPMVENADAENGFALANPSLEEKHPLHEGRFARLTMMGPGLALDEIAFVGEDGRPLPIASMHASGGKNGASQPTAALVDEQQLVPAHPSYLNGTYFDEIYHARTGYEHLHGLHTYEWTHPPLGKLLIAIGIKLFGMTAFGWRFMGALFGVLMVPLMYLLGKQLLKRTSLAFLVSFLMAADLMHFTQTRIATIDSFAVFFIMLMYFFMLRYYQMSSNHVRLWRTLVPLALSGISMGCAIATKWIGIYAAIGLAVLFFFTVWVRAREYRYVRRHMAEIDAGRRAKAQRIKNTFWLNLAVTGVWCVVFFVAVPLGIYYFSYYWQLRPDGNFGLDEIIRVQQNMLNYHAGLGYDNHPFKSRWYTWPFVGKPMWFYSGNEFMPAGWISSITCMGNPIVFWVGLVAMAFVLCRMFTHSRHDRRYIFLTVGFLSQYLPWVLVPRSMFIYHYFASVPFIILATGLGLDYIRRRTQSVYKVLLAALCVASLLMFAFFYPIASGTPIPLWYAKLTRWFDWINY